MRRTRDKIERAVQAERLRLAPELEEGRQFKNTLGRLAVNGQEPVASLFTNTLLELGHAVRTSIVRNSFHALPPEEQAKWLTEIFGDETLKQALALERHKLQQDIDGERLIQIRNEAWKHGRLNMADLPIGTDVKIGLFTDNRIDDAVSYGSESDWWARLLKLQIIGGGQLHVLSDELSPDPISDANLEVAPRIYNPHDIIEIGTQYFGGSRGADNYIYQKTSMVQRLANSPDFIEDSFLIGFVTLDGKDAFDTDYL